MLLEKCESIELFKLWTLYAVPARSRSTSLLGLATGKSDGGVACLFPVFSLLQNQFIVGMNVHSIPPTGCWVEMLGDRQSFPSNFSRKDLLLNFSEKFSSKLNIFPDQPTATVFALSEDEELFIK